MIKNYHETEVKVLLIYSFFGQINMFKLIDIPNENNTLYDLF